jgi:hypothetical protein
MSNLKNCWISNLGNCQISKFQIWKVTKFKFEKLSNWTTKKKNWTTKKPTKTHPRVLSKLNWKIVFLKEPEKKQGRLVWLLAFLKVKGLKNPNQTPLTRLPRGNFWNSNLYYYPKKENEWRAFHSKLCPSGLRTSQSDLSAPLLPLYVLLLLDSQVICCCLVSWFRCVILVFFSAIHPPFGLWWDAGAAVPVSLPPTIARDFTFRYFGCSNVHVIHYCFSFLREGPRRELLNDP